MAWGNVIGTVIILLGFNHGAIALVRSLTAEPLVLRLHAPFMVAYTLLVVFGLLGARQLGPGVGVILLALYAVYLALNVSTMGPESAQPAGHIEG